MNGWEFGTQQFPQGGFCAQLAPKTKSAECALRTLRTLSALAKAMGCHLAKPWGVAVGCTLPWGSERGKPKERQRERCEVRQAVRCAPPASRLVEKSLDHDEENWRF